MFLFHHSNSSKQIKYPNSPIGGYFQEKNLGVFTVVGVLFLASASGLQGYRNVL